MTQFRHEWKHEISYMDLLVIRARMRAVARPDPHAIDGRYLIRSLYLDSPNDRALRDKLDGVSVREKFRIRYYNHDTSLIHLEKKSKYSSLGTKESACLTRQQAESICRLYNPVSVIKTEQQKRQTDEQAKDQLTGQTREQAKERTAGQENSICTGTEAGLALDSLAWMKEDPQPLVRELYHKILTQGLRPKVIVDYIREPFIFDPGNVRVTLDYDIRTGLRQTDFLNPETVTMPAADSPIILEVKWDNYLPSIIRDAVQLPNRRAGAFSKYASCRMYE